MNSLLKNRASMNLLPVGSIVLICLALVLQTTGQTPSSAQAPPTPTTTTTTTTTASSNSIRGRVSNPDGQPVSSIQVMAIAIGSRPETRQFGPGGGGFGMTQATTDEQGNFEIKGVRSMSYILSASSPGYVALPPTDDSGANIYRAGDMAQITLVKGAVITGRVSSTDEDALTGAQVSVQRVGGMDGEVMTSNNQFGQGFGRSYGTDDRGVYRIYGLMPGTYIVRASKRTDGGAVPGGVPGSAPGGAPAGPRIAPTYYPSSPRDTAGMISARAGEEVSGIDIRLRNDYGYTVSGRVISRGQDGEDPDVLVTLSLPASSGQPGTTIASAVQSNREDIRGGPAAARTGAATGFSFGTVPDGEYEVAARTMSRRGEVDPEAASAPRKVTVRGADIGGIELVLTPLANIEGRLSIDKTPNVAACPSPRTYTIGETLVTARRDNNTVWTRDQAPSTVGDFRFGGLDAGTYRLKIRLPGDNWYLKGLRSAANPNLGKTGIVVKSGQRVSGVTAVVTDGAALLAGQLTKGSGDKLAGMQNVFVFPAEADAADNLLRYAEVTTKTDGSFVAKNLAPGKYFVIAKALGKEATRSEAQNFGQAVELMTCQRMTDFKLVGSQ